MESHLSNLDAVRKSGDAPTDVVLLTSDKPTEGVGAHSLICCTISPVLRAALRPTSAFREGESRTVNLDYATSEVVEKMLSFACGGFGHGESCMSGDDAMDLLPLADRLDFAALRSACESTLESILTSENANDILACASACGSMALAVKARKIVDQPETSDVVRKLMDKKRKLVLSEEGLEKQISKMRKQLKDVGTQVKDTKDRIAFEMNRSLKEAATAAQASARAANGDAASTDLSPPTYPHKEGRKLIALPPVNVYGYGVSQKERDHLEKQHGFGSNDSVFDKLNDALEAALPGDVIELAPGIHGPMDPWHLVINKSVQIIGSGEETKLVAQQDGLIVVDSNSDVRISKVHIVDNDMDVDIPVALVKKNSRLWLDDCEFDLRKRTYDEVVIIEKDCSAFVERCKFIGGKASAVYVDLRAKEFFMADSFVTGAGEGTNDGGEEPFSPGECGAIEAACNYGTLPASEANWLVATVKMTLVRNTITNCYGPAVSYRTNVTVQKTSLWHNVSFRRAQWPGKAEVMMKDNKMSGNGLALTSEELPEGNEIYHNTHLDERQREEARNS